MVKKGDFYGNVAGSSVALAKAKNDMMQQAEQIDWSSPKYAVERRKTDVDLYNEVLSGLSVPNRALASYHKSKAGDYDIKRLRSDLVNAERMKLSPNFVENAVALSFSYPKYLNQLIPNAIPAFDTLWIEWDELKRFQCLQDHFVKAGLPRDDNDDNVSNRVGYLIKNHGTYFSYTMLICDQTKDEKTPKIMSPMLSWCLSNDPNVPVPQTLNDFTRIPYEQDKDEEKLKYWNEYYAANFLLALLSRTYIAIHEDASLVDKWRHNVQIKPHPLFHSTYLYQDGLIDYDPTWLRDTMQLTAHAIEGDLRFLVSVFALLNYPRFVREVRSPKKVSGIRWGKQLPKNEVKVIEIELPKRGVNVYEQLWTGHGTPKRQHVRRGHWRVYKDEFGRIKERIWIEPMVCGDPELGVIDHEYVLRVKKDKKNG